MKVDYITISRKTDSLTISISSSIMMSGITLTKQTNRSLNFIKNYPRFRIIKRKNMTKMMKRVMNLTDRKTLSELMNEVS